MKHGFASHSLTSSKHVKPAKHTLYDTQVGQSVETLKFFTSTAETRFLTSEPRRTFASVSADRVYTPTDGTRRRHACVHILAAALPLSAVGTCAQVLPAACWEINVRQTRSSVLASARQHVDLQSSGRGHFCCRLWGSYEDLC